MKPSYQELLRRPEWDDKRKHILRRDHWQCLYCNTTDEEMHVHHILYTDDGAMPWEYEDDELFTLCGKCHAEEEIIKSTSEGMLVWAASNGILYMDMQYILGRLTKAVIDKPVAEKRHIIGKYINYLP
ncbi:MAG: hypothetical protein KW793_03915 [Candidatus Doudnabacteria bacterium]|nr:hypothetical protein [Candidatus Doudnabacteria bacterium]